MKPVDALLIAALVCLSLAVSFLAVPVALLVAAAGCVGLWWLLDDGVDL